MSSPIRVFLSSTYSDLAPYRDEVMSILVGCGAVLNGMELFGASQSTPLETCLRQVEDADLVLAILGMRYGSSPPGSEQSFTELEIDQARRLNKPIWAYLLNEEKAWVNPKCVDTGMAAEKLRDFKSRLRQELTVAFFESPSDLAAKIARDLYNRHRVVQTTTDYRECSYDLLAEWYDPWYQGHWSSDQPFKTICAIAAPYFEADRGNLHTKRILDVACGTGNAFVAFAREGYDVWGADGSRAMLKGALDNCQSVGIPVNQLISEPIMWTDREAYLKYWKPGSFDLITNTANSFCHIPPIPEYMQTALRNFHELLIPGGLLMVDTKRYVRSAAADGTPMFKELRHIRDEGEWIERVDRKESRVLKDLGNVTFHTRIVHDSDPSFGPVVQRALIVITIYGQKLSPRTLVVPYYPLPGRLLQAQMAEAGFHARRYPALRDPNANWKYDFVVGRKPS